MHKILIVDDNLPLANLLALQLKQKATTDIALHGEMAVEKVKQVLSHYDAIIMDIEMPLMNGLEATRRIRALGYTKPIIGFSSREDKREKALQAGMNHFVPKGMDKKT